MLNNMSRSLEFGGIPFGFTLTRYLSHFASSYVHNHHEGMFWKSVPSFREHNSIDKNELSLSIQAKVKVILLADGITAPTWGLARPIPAFKGFAYCRENQAQRQVITDLSGNGWAGIPELDNTMAAHVTQTCQFLVTNGATRGVLASSKASTTCDDWKPEAVS